MAPRIEALVKPDLLTWARETAGLSLEEAARKAQVKPERLQGWESGESRPTIVQLRKLAHVYRRPLAVFYLSKPPKRFQAMHDFRRLPGAAPDRESYELRLEIRRAQYRRGVALNLQRDLGLALPDFGAAAGLEESAEAVAERVRTLFGISYAQQTSWKNDHQAFNSWRAAAESLGVLVFQITGVEVTEARGFSISDSPLPVIAVNIKDHPKGRIFSLLHEFAHLMLREAGLCDMQEDTLRTSDEQRVEIFCNGVAGAALLPESHLLHESIVRSHPAGDPEWTDDELETLARRYRAGREAVLRRLLAFDLTTADFYRKKRRQFQQQYEKLREEAGGFAPPHRVALSSAGPLFTRLVLNGFLQEKITSSDVASYLEIKLKHMHEVERAVSGQRF